jgi:hypothetical protein
MAGPVGIHGRAKQWLAEALGLGDAALHAHGGMVIWVAGVLVAGDIGALWPLLLVIAAELLNEGFDRLRTGSWRWRDTVQDIVHSVLWPSLLFGCARLGLF